MVTLRQFCNICKNVIAPYYCKVYIEKEDENYGTITDQIKSFSREEFFIDEKELEPYYDYEIIAFEQYFCYGELDDQYIYLMEVKYDH